HWPVYLVGETGRHQGCLALNGRYQVFFVTGMGTAINAKVRLEVTVESLQAIVAFFPAQRSRVVVFGYAGVGYPVVRSLVVPSLFPGALKPEAERRYGFKIVFYHS